MKNLLVLLIGLFLVTILTSCEKESNNIVDNNINDTITNNVQTLDTNKIFEHNVFVMVDCFKDNVRISETDYFWFNINTIKNTIEYYDVEDDMRYVYETSEFVSYTINNNIILFKFNSPILGEVESDYTIKEITKETLVLTKQHTHCQYEYHFTHNYNVQ